MTGSRLFLYCALLLLVSLAVHARAASSSGFLVVANQGDHTALVVDIARNRTIGSVTVGVNGHELAVSPDGRFAYVPIYGNSGVGRPGTDGSTIDLGKPVRPHCARFGPNGLLYVTAELADSVYAIDINSRKVVAEIPTGARESHMMVLSPDGRRAYSANVGAGSVSVLDLENHSLVTVLGIAPTIQRISISPDGRYIFTHDQTAPRIAMVDTRANEVVRWIPVPAIVYSSAVAPDNRTLVANSPSGKLFVLDIVTGNVQDSIDIPKAVGEIALTPDGRMAYVSCPQAGTIESVDLETGTHTGTILLSKGADGLAWVPSLPSL